MRCRLDRRLADSSCASRPCSSCGTWTGVSSKFGTRLHELVEVGAVGLDKAQSHRFLDESLIPFFNAGMENIKAAGLTEMDCGQGIAQATLVAFEQGLGTCLIGVPANKKLRRAIGLPADCKILVVQTVGYPAESPEAGGQRPRLPFEQQYFLNNCSQPFPRDEKVIEGLKQDKMIQNQAPLPWRWAELAYLARALEISPIFGDEVPEMMEHIVKDMMDTES